MDHPALMALRPVANSDPRLSSYILDPLVRSYASVCSSLTALIVALFGSATAPLDRRRSATGRLTRTFQEKPCYYRLKGHQFERELYRGATLLTRKGGREHGLDVHHFGPAPTPLDIWPVCPSNLDLLDHLEQAEAETEVSFDLDR